VGTLQSTYYVGDTKVVGTLQSTYYVGDTNGCGDITVYILNSALANRLQQYNRMFLFHSV
jgi:hypothetical protein